jgi:hypothetical protein
MYWMLIGTLCLLTNASDPTSLTCVRIASDIKFIDYNTCNLYSHTVVEDLREDTRTNSSVANHKQSS